MARQSELLRPRRPAPTFNVKLQLPKRKEFVRRIAKDQGQQRGALLALMCCAFAAAARGDKE
jgi:hypothetical protein